MPGPPHPRMLTTSQASAQSIQPCLHLAFGTDDGPDAKYRSAAELHGGGDQRACHATEDEQHNVATAIVEHLEQSNWKIESGSPLEGHGQHIIPPRSSS
jgi:hypothetical protein